MPGLIYEGSTGFIIDIEIAGVDSLAGVENEKLIVLPPGASEVEEWTVHSVVNDKVFRHVVAPGVTISPGQYQIQPYFKLGSFEGPWEIVYLDVDRKLK